MKRIFINLGLFIIIMFPPLYLLQYMVTVGLRNTYFTRGCMNDIYNGKAACDVLIMGASNAKFQYSPKILDSELHLNNYNIGISGWPFHMQYALFKIYQQHNKKPTYIVQNINGMLLNYQDEFYEAEQFMPYARDTIVQKFTSHLKGAFTVPELYFPMFIYNNHFEFVMQGIKSYFHIGPASQPPTYKGYIPHLEEWDNTFDEFKKQHPAGIRFSYSDTVLKEFVSFLNDCKAQDIKVIFVYAPIYKEETKMVINHNDMCRLYDSIAHAYSIPVIDYNNDAISYEKTNFFNSQHLNIKGSEAFSKKLGNDLQQYIKP
ncbi:MAG: hypothetical protein H7257_07185 [Taibaiella sp.]|nr:hypothetical protein [Taibaiella sp.]